MKNEKLFHEIANKINGAVKSQLFGKQSYKINGKAFCCFFQNEMVFKLTAQTHSKAINLEGSQLFDPSGKNRPMKQWVQIPISHSDLWLYFCNSAAQFVK